jgi:hypothetical protein
VSTILSSIGAAAAENVSLVGSAGFTAFALTGFGLMWRSWRKELNRLSFNYTKRDRQTIILLNTITRAGVQIPEEYYSLERAKSPDELDLAEEKNR